MSARVLIVDVSNPSSLIRGLALYSIRFADDAVQKERLPEVIAAMSDPMPQVRYVAAGTLGAIGPGAVEAVPAIVAALVDDDEDVSERAAEALGKIGTRKAVEALTRCLKTHGRKYDAKQKLLLS